MASYIGTILGIGTVCTTSYIAYAGREVNDIRGSNLLPFLGAAIVTWLIYYFVFLRIPTIGTRMKLIYGLILYNIIQYLIHTYSPTGLAIWKPDRSQNATISRDWEILTHSILKPDDVESL